MMSFRPFAFEMGRPSAPGSQSAKTWSRRFATCLPVVINFTFLMGTTMYKTAGRNGRRHRSMRRSYLVLDGPRYDLVNALRPFVTVNVPSACADTLIQ